MLNFPGDICLVGATIEQPRLDCRSCEARRPIFDALGWVVLLRGLRRATVVDPDGARGPATGSSRS